MLPQKKHTDQASTKLPIILHVYIISLLFLLASILAGMFIVNNTLRDRVEVYANTDVNVPYISTNEIEQQLEKIDSTIERLRNSQSTTDTGDIERHLEAINNTLYKIYLSID